MSLNNHTWGTEATGNVGGLNCVVDNGSDNPPVHNVLDVNKVLAFFETTSADYAKLGDYPKAWSIAADAEGNIYVYFNNPSYVLVKYDIEGRLVALCHRAMHHAFNLSLGSTSTNTAYLRLATRPVNVPLNEDDPDLDTIQVMFMSTAGKCVAGVNVYPTGDFNRDGLVTQADMEFFQAQLDKSQLEVLPVLADGDSYLDYLKADLNGSSELNSTKDGVLEACVTAKDIEILHQFVMPGDANLDGVVNAADLDVVTANVGVAGAATWAQGDFDFDEDVDAADLALLTAQMK